MAFLFFKLFKRKEGTLILDAGGKIRNSFYYVCTIASPLLFFFSSPVFASRPLTTDDAGTVQKGEFQVETGFDFARQDHREAEISPSLTVSYGLLEKMDVWIGSEYLFVRHEEGENEENGLGDTALRLKYRFFDEADGMPAFAVSGMLKVPTASESKGLGSGKTDFSINTILTKNLGERLVLHLNLGYTFIGEKHCSNELNYSLAAQFILTDRWALVGEVVAMNHLNGRHGDDPLSGLVGTYYLITDKIIWDAGIGIGMSRAAPNFQFTTGFTLLFKP